ncbi:MAG: mannose-1-phosphate guanylyltransferase [Candidatus Omnitrophota bacterium]|nr:MAG: mannose-1-phosphate guanylyltransferase [Candidatus Omnitrophota bacterium]
MNKVYAVLMAGGKGTRLWPLSRAGYSKSFVRVGKIKPAIAQIIGILQGLIAARDTIVVVDKAQEALLRRFARHIPRQNILVEPFGRSTASAVGLAAIELDPDDIMVVLPTDFLIREKTRFKSAIKAAIDFVCRKEGVLLCIGTRPKEAKASYGYIKIKSRQRGSVYSIDKFIEKPSEKTAQKLIKKPDYLWNTGIFVFKANDILEAMKARTPLLYRELSRIKKDKKSKKTAYSRMKNVSIDYQIMEKAKNLYCVKGNFSWQDLGNWKSAGELFKKKKYGNITFGRATLIDTHGSIIYNSEKSQLGVVGLTDMIVAHTKNGTLVCSKKGAEKVKELIARL